MISGTTELDRLVQRSRLLGASPELVVHGGGNTSTKTAEPDHRGRRRRVLRVKGSGTDLASIGPDGFPGLFLDDLEALRDLPELSDEEMVAYLAHCMLDPGSRAPSIETLLHAFIPTKHVDHVHADAICALTNHPEGPRAVREALGDDVAYVPYVRPGFELSKRVAELAGARAVVLEHHGLVTWADDHQASVDLTWELVGAAEDHLRRHGAMSTRPTAVEDAPDADELAARLRAALLARGGRCVLHVDRRQRALADRPDAAVIARDGRATPDHILRIGVHGALLCRPLEIVRVLDEFAADYRAGFERHRHRLPPGQPMLSPLPRVFLVPGLGCVATAPTPRAARVAADIALRSHTVAAAALDAFGRLKWLDETEAFDFDYWPMELRKLALAPDPPALTGTVVVLGGACEPAAAALAGAGATVCRTASAAVAEHGGVDVVIVDATDAEPVAAVRDVWRRSGGTGTVVQLADLDAAAAVDGAVVVAGSREDPALARAVLYAAGEEPGGLHGSVLRTRGSVR